TSMLYSNCTGVKPGVRTAPGRGSSHPGACATGRDSSPSTSGAARTMVMVKIPFSCESNCSVVAPTGSTCRSYAGEGNAMSKGGGPPPSGGSCVTVMLIAVLALNWMDSALYFQGTCSV